jgi:hypothetical protein
MSRREHETQVMINIAHAFATMEGYKLQPAKSVIINIQPNKRKQSMMDQEYILIMTCVSCSRLLISAISSAHALALPFTFPIFIPRYESLRLLNRGFDGYTMLEYRTNTGH